MIRLHVRFCIRTAYSGRAKKMCGTNDSRIETHRRYTGICEVSER
jgi:hypothetical protein